MVVPGEAFLESYSVAHGTTPARVLRLAPASFGPWNGFCFEVEFESATGVPMKGSGRGAILDEELHLFFYAGASEYYFDEHLPAFEAIIASISA